MYESSKKSDEDRLGDLEVESDHRQIEETNAKREILKLPYMALVVCLLLTVGATYLSYTTSLNRDKLRFNGEISSVEENLISKINSYETLLKATKGFVETNENMDRRKFAAFVKSFNLENDYGGVQGIGYTVRVDADNRENFIMEVREKGIPDFKIFPLAAKDEFQTIIYLEPLDFRNKRAIGFDMTSEKTRREAMFAARDSGTIMASGKVTLLQETDANVQSGFLVYLPVYGSLETPPTIEERRDSLKGFIYSPFRAQDFLSDIMNAVPGQEIGVLIYDEVVAPENLLAQSQPDLLELDSRFESVEELEFAGRKWQIVYKSIPSLYDHLSVDFSIPILAVGIVLSLFIFFITYLETSSRLKYQTLAENLTIAEQEKAQLLESEQAARRRAEESVKAKNEFISTVSHELRTPLNAISGWTRILKGEQIGAKTKERAFKTIEKNIQTQSNLIEELLDFSKIANVKQIENENEVDFSAVFANSIAKTQPNAQRKEINLEYENLLGSEKIRGNQKNIEKVFLKILENAVKFTPNKGNIKASIKREDGTIKFIVNDTGKGIKRDFLSKVFEGFSQEDSSSTRKFGGFGLGLTYSNHVIKHHGGKLEIISDGENKGTTIVVNFPIDSSLN